MERFNVNEFLANQGQAEKGIAVLERPKQLENGALVTFSAVCKLFEENFEKEFQKEDDSERRKILAVRHDAIVGKPESVTMIMEKIQTFLNKNNFNSLEYPKCYEGIVPFAPDEQRKYSELTHAIFHEVYGYGPLAFWNKFPESYAAQILGTKIYMHINRKKQKMDFEFSSPERVWRIINSLTYHHEQNKISRYQPILKTDLYTGERVTCAVPPRINKPVITFRRFLIEYVTLEMLAQKGSFPSELIPLLRGIAKTMANIVIAGPPGTGKSTFLKAMFNERDEDMTSATIERLYELALDRDYPNRAHLSYLADEEHFHHILDEILTSDVDFAVIGEILRVEVEGYLLVAERLLKGAMTTYHTQKVIDIPAQWARLILDRFPTRNFDVEMARVADKVDLVFELRHSKDKTTKWLHSIQELRLDAFTGEITATYWVKFDPIEGVYRYHDQIGDMLFEEMRSADPYWADQVKQILTRLAAEKPILGDPTTYFNPIAKEPLNRIATALEKPERA